VDAVLDRVREFDWLVFSSANGVRFLLDRLGACGGDARRLASVRLAAIGPGTAAVLQAYHLRADHQPAEYRAESLAASLSADAAGKRFLLARASRGREVLAQQLCQAGGHVEQVVVYRSEDVPQADAHVLSRLESGSIDYITVTSSAIARSLVRLFGERLQRAQLVSISPVTTATLRELGYPPAIEATDYSMPGVVAALKNAASRRAGPAG
jgi:uroporphyrinogen III methyltransferase/synthase